MTKKRKTQSSKVQSNEKTQSKSVANTAVNSLFINKKLHLIILFVFGFLLYANTITHDYTQDDAIVINDNDFVKKGFSGIGEILGNDTFLGFFKVKKNLVAGGRYRPLSLVTFAVEYQFFGESPTVSHFINVVLYALTGMLLYLVVLQFFHNKSTSEGYFIALATAMLFLAHPIHTEAVANIKGRDEIMALLGSLGALYFAMKYALKGNFVQLIFAGICFFLGILSKENTITFLAVIPLAIFTFTKTEASKIGISTSVLVAFAAAFLIIRSSILGDAANLTANANMELMNNPYLKWTGSQYVDFSSGEKFGTIFYTLGKYLVLLIFPHPLTHDYYPPQIPMMTFADGQVIFTLLIYIGAGIYALMRLPKKDPIAFGIIYFIATLSVVSNLVFPIGTNMGERFMFMPSVGVCLIAAVLLYKLANKRIANWSDLKLALPIIALFLVGFSLKTVVRNMAWKNNYTLFSTDIQTSINSAKLNNSMAGITSEEAIKPENAAKKQQMLNDAIRYGLKARELHPTYANPNVIIGNAYLYLGDYQKSIEFYDYTLRITGEGSSDYTNALNNKKVALANIKPEYLTKQGEALANQQFAEAIRIGEQAIAAGNISVELFGQQGAAYGANGQHQKALEMFQKVLQLDPNSAQGYLNMGYAYQGLGDTANTNASFEKAYSLDSNLRPK
jgi:tetratricopeptide (TPR) repeat protein